MSEGVMDKFIEVLKREVGPLMDGVVFDADLNEIKDGEQLAALYAVLQFLESELKERKAAARERLLKVIIDKGEKSRRGGLYIPTKFGLAIREERVSKLPDETLLKKLLAESRLPASAVYTEKREMVLDPSKLLQLVDRGSLTEEGVETTRKKNYALVFKPSEEVDAAFNELFFEGE